MQPVGLVVAPILLKELGLAPTRQTQADTAMVAEYFNGDASKPALHDPWTFFEKTLGWEARHVAGAPSGPQLTSDVCLKLDKHDCSEPHLGSEGTGQRWFSLAASRSH